jgi:hypothetical protein
MIKNADSGCLNLVSRPASEYRLQNGVTDHRIRNGYILIQTKRGFEHHTQTWIWFGPLGRSCVPVSAPAAALGLTATTIAFFALGFLWLFELNHEKQTV